MATEGRSGPTSQDPDLGFGARTERVETQADPHPCGRGADAAPQLGAVPMPALLERVDEAPFVGRTAALRRLRAALAERAVRQ